MHLRLGYHWRVCAFALACAGLAESAFAQAKPADPDFDSGRALMSKGDYSGACVKFQASYDRAHSPGRALNLSACEEKQNHLVKAMAWLDEALQQLGSEDDRAPGARAKRDELEARLGKIVVQAPNDAPPGTSFAIGDRRVRGGARTSADPGVVVVTARAPDHEDATASVDVREGQVETITLGPGPRGRGTPPPVETPVDTKANEAATPPIRVESPHAPAALASQPRGGPQRAAGWISLGVGAASLAGAAITGGIMLAKNGKYHSCGPRGDDPCSKSENADAAGARSLGAALEVPNAVMWGVGAVGVALCPVLVLTAPHDRAVAVGPVVGPSRWGAVAGGTF